MQAADFLSFLTITQEALLITFGSQPNNAKQQLGRSWQVSLHCSSVDHPIIKTQCKASDLRVETNLPTY